MKLIQKELKTERLTLSRPYMTDVEDFYAALSNGEIFRYNAWNKHDNALETLAFLNNLMIRWITGRQNGRFAKTTGIKLSALSACGIIRKKKTPPR